MTCEQQIFQHFIGTHIRDLFELDLCGTLATLFQSGCRNNISPSVIGAGRRLSVTCRRNADVNAFMSWHSRWVLSSLCSVGAGFLTCDIGFASHFNTQHQNNKIMKFCSWIFNTLPLHFLSDSIWQAQSTRGCLVCTCFLQSQSIRQCHHNGCCP